MTLLRTGIFHLNPEQDYKNWRPNILVLSGAPTKRWNLIELANSLSQNRGLITVSSVLPSGSRDLRQQGEMEITVREYLDRHGVQALVRMITAPDMLEGGLQLLESYGIGPLIPNTFLLGASSNPERRELYCDLIAQIHLAKRNAIILHDDRDRGFGLRRQIDLWWSGFNNNGSLMLLLAYLLSSDVDWREATINLKLVVEVESAADTARKNVKSLVEELRLGKIEVKVLVDGRPFPQILRESSQKADLVFLGLPEPDENFVKNYERLLSWTSDLTSTIFVLAASDYAHQKILT